jgi:membrane-associated phospholipid phosphatase
MSRMSWRAVPGPEGPALLAAVAFSILMGLSRAYLRAHWLSDAVAGILLGISCAVLTALMIGQIQRRVEGRQGAA